MSCSWKQGILTSELISLKPSLTRKFYDQLFQKFAIFFRGDQYVRHKPLALFIPRAYLVLLRKCRVIIP